VSNGVVGRYRDVLSPRTVAILDRKWAAVIAPETGLADYAALDAALRARATRPVAA
jgi:hypothetical protein